MTPPLDTSTFQIGVPPDEDHADEQRMLEALANDARAFVEAFSWAPPIADLLLAFGIGDLIGLFLARFTEGLAGEGHAGEGVGDTEMWVVVGDLPYLYFETEDAPTPAMALLMYCAIAQDWADNVVEGNDLSESYPIPVEPTEENARRLLSRIEFIRENFVQAAGDPERIAT